MVDVQQITVQVEMAVLSHLHSGIGGLRCRCARRKRHLGVDGERRQSYLGEALGGEFSLVYYDILDIRVGRLLPMGSEWCHCVGRAEGSWLLVSFEAGIAEYLVATMRQLRNKSDECLDMNVIDWANRANTQRRGGMQWTVCRVLQKEMEEQQQIQQMVSY